MRRLLEVIRNGRPDNKSQVHDLITPFWKVRDELSEYNGVIFKGSQAAIPNSMRKEMLEKLHYTHLGYEKTLLKAKELSY